MQLSGGVRLSLQDTYNQFRNAGLDHGPATKIASVVHIESGGYTGSFGGQPTERGGVLNPGGAYGLAQFNGPRQGQLAAFAARAGGSPSDPGIQTRFIVQDAQNRGINLNSTSDIVNRYEVPRQDLRAGEIFRSNQNVARLSNADANYTAPMNSNDPLGTTGGSGLSAPGTASGGMYSGVETSAGSNITGFKQNADGSADVQLGFDEGSAGSSGFGSGSAQTTGFDSTGGFTGANVAGGSQAGAFGLGGITSGGQTVGMGNAGAGGTSAAGEDPIVGYGAMGPVTANPTLVGATNSVASATAKGTKQIGDDTKAAGKTIGESVTGLGKTLSGISSSWQSLGTDYFTRLAFIVVGLIALAAALMMFKPVQNAAATVASAVPAGRAARAVSGSMRKL